MFTMPLLYYTQRTIPPYTFSYAVSTNQSAGFAVSSTVGVPSQILREEAEGGRDAQSALVIGRPYVSEHDSAPVQYNGIV